MDLYNKEELKKEYLQNLKDKKIVVEVQQSRDGEKKEVVNYWNNEKENIFQLLGLLYQKTILKSDNLKIKYKYNYNDLQEISFILSYTNYDNTITKTFYNFKNVPTSLSFLDTYKLREVFKNE